MNKSLIAKLPGNITISANNLNYILDFGQRDCWYYSTLEDLCDGILEIRLKNAVLKSKISNDAISSLKKAVENARASVSKDLEVLIEATYKRTANVKKPKKGVN